MKRREFLTIALGAAAVMPVLIQPVRPVPDFVPPPEFQNLIRHFDRKSEEDKRKFVEGFNSIEFEATRHDSQDLAADCNLAINEMKIFFQKRLASSVI